MMEWNRSPTAFDPTSDHNNFGAVIVTILTYIIPVLFNRTRFPTTATSKQFKLVLGIILYHSWFVQNPPMHRWFMLEHLWFPIHVCNIIELLQWMPVYPEHTWKIYMHMPSYNTVYNQVDIGTGKHDDIRNRVCVITCRHTYILVYHCQTA